MRKKSQDSFIKSLSCRKSWPELRWGPVDAYSLPIPLSFSAWNLGDMATGSLLSPRACFFFSDATWRNLLKTCWCQKRHQKHGNDFASDFRVFLRRSEVTTKICRSGEKRELLPALQILKPLQHVRFPHFKGFLIPIPSLFQWFFYFCSHCEVKDLPEHFKCFFASTEARAMERMFVFQPFEGKQQISKRSLLCTSFTSFWNKDALETEWTNPKSKGSVLRF